MRRRKLLCFILGTVLIFSLGAFSGYFYGIHSMQVAANAAAEQRMQLEIKGDRFCDQIGYAVESHDLAWLTGHYAAEVSEEQFSIYDDLGLIYQGNIRGDTRAWDTTTLSRDYTLLFACSSPVPQTLRDSLPTYKVMEIEETEQFSIVVYVEKSAASSWSYVIQSLP